MMKLKIFCLILLQYLVSSWSFQIHAITDKMSNIQKVPNQNRLNELEEDSKIEFSGKKTKIKRVEESFEKTNMRNSYGGDTTVLSDLIIAITNSGYAMLKNLENQIDIHLKLSLTNGLPILEEILNNYFDSVESYITLVFKQMVKCELEREFYTLDLIDTASKILANESFVLLTHIMSKSKENSDSIFKDNIAKLIIYIEKAVINEKKHNFEYICEKLSICRQYPAYSDRIAEIINEIIVLPDTKFRVLLILLNDMIETKAAFLRTIMDIDYVFSRNMTSKFRYLQDNVTEARKIFTTVKDIINKKHKIYKSLNGEIKIRKKALRILIDLFDKSFETLAEEFINAEVNNVIYGLKAWEEKKSIDIQKILKVFFDNIEKGLQPFLKLPGVRVEVKTLIDIIVTGTSKNMNRVDKNLFIRGSKYVSGRLYIQSNSLDLIEAQEL